MNVDVSRVAVIMLACQDYESLELSLACHTAYGADNVTIYILLNCRGSYDSLRTLKVARRYAELFPKNVKVIDHIPPGPPFKSIKYLINSAEFQRYDLICKVDDDTFPISHGWIQKLVGCWNEEHEKNDKLAYVTPLINNNNWGFPTVLDVMGIRERYFHEVARPHLVGPLETPSLCEANQIDPAGHGTIWRYAHIARWLHKETTLKPQEYINATAGKPRKIFPHTDRYSIGCILFRRSFWDQIDDGSNDDEHMIHSYCAKNESLIVCEISVPFVHLSFYTQRDENRDIVSSAKLMYEKRLALSFPISMIATREQEIEERLRWLEHKLDQLKDVNRSPSILDKVRNYLFTLIRIIKRKPS